jgi:outer membrane lipoprotein-sorting protein
LLLLTQTAASQTAAAPTGWDLPQLLRPFGVKQHAEAHYIERKYLSVVKQPIEDRGILVYVAPNYLRKETLAPHHELLVVDGDTLTVARDNKTQTLSRGDYPQIWAFIEGIRATLAGDANALEKVYTVSLDGNEAAWQLLLEPRDPAMQKIVSSIRISGGSAAIKSIETVEADGDRTEMDITEDSQ